MNLFKRACISSTRHPLKTLTLILALTISFLFVNFSILMLDSTSRISDNILRQFPAVTTVYLQNSDSIGADNVLTLNQLQDITTFHGVKSYDINVLGEVVTRNIKPVFTPTLTLEQAHLLNVDELIDSMYLPQGDFIPFSLHGVQNPHIIDIQTGLIDLILGEHFTQKMIDEGAPYAIISSAFAKENELTVGSSFILESNVFDFRDLGRNWWRGVWREDSIFWSKGVELTVLGIFDMTTTFDYINESEIAAIRDFELQNRLYLPNTLVEQINNETQQHLIYVEQFSEELVDLPRNIFLLYNHRYIHEFIEFSNHLLDYPYYMTDLSNAVAHIQDASEHLYSVILSFTIASTVLLFCLTNMLIIYFIAERKKEIGIYMALGEKLSKIIFRFLIEFFIISSVSFILAFLFSNVFLDFFEGALLEMLLNAQSFTQQENISANSAINTPIALSFFTGGSQNQLPFNMIDDFIRISLNLHTILSIVAISILGLALTSLLLFFYFSRLQPKKMLLD